MYILKIKLDDKKVLVEKKYQLDSLYKALDYLFAESLGLEKTITQEEAVTYISEQENKDAYAQIIGMCISLKNNSEWFVRYVAEWELYSPDTGLEDLIEMFLD